ncbi:MAG: winged helix-turn-helix transcriptional regulator [Lachnospiraceae bacterium]|nr:winged helix-turn-helix transcriptional regulator [Lachnospiraceae bacterium]
MDNKKVASMFKAFCDENRLQILQLLQSGEKCACRLLEEMQITQPTLSHHMKILCDAGIVIGRKEGKWMHYSISEKGVECAADYLGQLVKNTGKGGDNCESCR